MGLYSADGLRGPWKGACLKLCLCPLLSPSQCLPFFLSLLPSLFLCFLLPVSVSLSCPTCCYPPFGLTQFVQGTCTGELSFHSELHLLWHSQPSPFYLSRPAGPASSRSSFCHCLFHLSPQRSDCMAWCQHSPSGLPADLSLCPV